MMKKLYKVRWRMFGLSNWIGGESLLVGKSFEQVEKEMEISWRDITGAEDSSSSFEIIHIACQGDVYICC